MSGAPSALCTVNAIEIERDRQSSVYYTHQSSFGVRKILAKVCKGQIGSSIQMSENTFVCYEKYSTWAQEEVPSH